MGVAWGCLFKVPESVPPTCVMCGEAVRTGLLGVQPAGDVMFWSLGASCLFTAFNSHFAQSDLSNQAS